MNKTHKAGHVRSGLAALVVLSSSLLGGHPAAATAGAAMVAAPVDQSLDSVVVTGTGEVFGTPDTLIVNFAVETSASSVDKALDSANTATTRMRDALVHAGTAKADLQTADVGITSQKNDAGVITAYAVNQGLTAKIRNLPRSGAMMTAAVTAGGDATRLNGVSFAIEDEAALLNEARKKAFADARGKAELYARQAGRPLDRVVRLSEETPSFARPMMYATQGSDKAVPIEPGRQRVAVTVTVEWAFRPLS